MDLDSVHSSLKTPICFSPQNLTSFPNKQTTTVVIPSPLLPTKLVDILVPIINDAFDCLTFPMPRCLRFANTEGFFSQLGDRGPLCWIFVIYLHDIKEDGVGLSIDKVLSGELDGEFVVAATGILKFGPERATLEEDGVFNLSTSLFLQSLAVPKSLQNHGLGSRLLTQMEKFAVDFLSSRKTDGSSSKEMVTITGHVIRDERSTEPWYLKRGYSFGKAIHMPKGSWNGVADFTMLPIRKEIEKPT